MVETQPAKLTIEMVINLLNTGYTVFQIAQMTGRHEYSVRYLLRKHGCHRVVRWECTDLPKTDERENNGAEVRV